MAVLAANFIADSPVWLSIACPLAIAPFIIVRAIYWLPMNVARRPVEVLRSDLERMKIIEPAIALMSVIWALTLYGWGDATQRSLIHYMVSVTTFVAIMGLNQAPSVALRVALAAIIPSSAWFLVQDHPNGILVAMVQPVVTILILAVVASNHRHFLKLLQSREEIETRRRDATEFAEINQQLAATDSLTGAPNRRAILDELGAALARSTDEPPWLAVIDLDGFKGINDTYGHAGGDAVLCAVARRIAGHPAIAAFGRLGGDEFALLLPGALPASEAVAVMGQLSGMIEERIAYNSELLRIGCSIGLYRAQSGSDVTDCLERADSVLYRAKKQAKTKIATYEEQDEVALEERRTITRIFNSTNLIEQISLVYQPVVDIDTDQIVSLEALARWSPDGKTWLLPGRFVDVAESTGRIAELTDAVLSKSLRECPAWKYGCSISVNLSAADIIGDGAPERLNRIVEEAGAPPQAVIFEITEAAILSDYEDAAVNLRKLRATGFRVALDDFGTGQSSLGHVHRLPLNQIKIDSSFASALETNGEARAIASTILALARQLHLDCTIEGIENVHQLASARALGVRHVQGYVFGQPMNAAQAIGALSSSPGGTTVPHSFHEGIVQLRALRG
jgi:diguanylate cyclase (GGDEF)-like protein